jgi:methylase of polypeptide subunit release factors
VKRVDSFLDLGCGDGVLTAAVLGEHPDARAVVLELVPGPTEVAHTNLKEFEQRVTYLPADIAYPNWIEALGADPQFDAIVCGFALQPSPTIANGRSTRNSADFSDLRAFS